MIETQSKVTFRPLAKRVLLRMIELGDTRSGSVIIRPEETREMPNEAIVVALSIENKHNLSIGDRVAVGKYSGADIQVGDEILRVLSEDDVLGVFDVER